MNLGEGRGQRTCVFMIEPETQRCSVVATLNRRNVTCAGFLSTPKKARRWMRVDSGWPVDAEQLASRLRFNPELGKKVADEIQPGTTVVITDQPVVRKPKSDSTFFAVN